VGAGVEHGDSSQTRVRRLRRPGRHDGLEPVGRAGQLRAVGPDERVDRHRPGAQDLPRLRRRHPARPAALEVRAAQEVHPQGQLGTAVPVRRRPAPARDEALQGGPRLHPLNFLSVSFKGSVGQIYHATMNTMQFALFDSSIFPRTNKSNI